MKNVKIVDRQPVQVAYLRHTGPYGPAIGEFWMETVAPWMGTNNLYRPGSIRHQPRRPERDESRQDALRRLRRESAKAKR